MADIKSVIRATTKITDRRIKRIAASEGVKRNGPLPLPADEKRMLSVNVRFNQSELDELDRQRGSRQRAEWLRMAWTETLPPTIPEINREAWEALARANSNLNQISAKINGGFTVNIHDVNTAVIDLRNALIGAKNES